MSAVRKPQRSKEVLKKLLRQQFGVMTTVSEKMSRDQLDALYVAYASGGHLADALLSMTIERNEKAAKNSSCQGKMRHIESQRDKARETLSYTEDRLESCERRLLNILNGLLDVHQSEIYSVIKQVVNRVKGS